MPYLSVFDELRSACAKVHAETSEHVLLVFAGQSKLEHYESGKLVKTYTISTGKNPPSNAEGSNGTPPGLHVICEKIGADEPMDTVFISRVSTGKTWRELKAAGEPAEKARVTSRILRLKGLEEGVNAGPGVDSYARFIYIHGTVFEDRIGQPTSAGCITLLNRDMLELFSSVPVGTLVYVKA
jgi:lipoprotein-anchoring transpeptidase ErfK/SrfK